MILFSVWEKELKHMVEIGSIYVWGGQGEERPTDAWIKARETSANNAKRDIALRDKRYKQGYKDLRAFDCSGLGIYILQKYGEIKNDMSAQGIYTKCKVVKKTDLKAGDFVFRVYTSGTNKGKAHHIGYVISENKVIHAKGRDVGVVEETLNQNGENYWNAFGRSTWVENKKDGYADYVFTQNLYRKKCEGKKMEDVKALQWLLNENGFDCGSIDGYFGKNTEKAVKKAQKLFKLTQDGIAGKNTIKALGGTWK